MNCRKFYKIVLSFLFVSLDLLIYSKSFKNDYFEMFAYPVLQVESMRHDLAQGVYFLQQSVADESDDCSRAIAMFEQADNSSVTRDELSFDDQAFLQAMLERINALIENLEAGHEQRSVLSYLYTRLQSRF